MRLSSLLVVLVLALAAAPCLADPPVFENGTPVGFSVADSAAKSQFVAGNSVSVRVDLNQAATYEYPVVGNFHALERSEQLSGQDTDGLQIDVAMVKVVPFGTSANLPAPGVTQVATSSPVIHAAWVEQRGLSAGTFWSGGITPVYQVRYAHSYDLGSTFSAPVSVSGEITYHPLTALANGPFASLDLEVDSGGHPRVAYAFVSTADQARDQNVYFAYSQDGGENWEAPLVVNDPTTAGNSEGRHCAFPRLAIDDRDNVFISYVRGVSSGAGTDDVMLAKVNRAVSPFDLVPVGSLGAVGSSGGVRLSPDDERHMGPDLAVGDGDALHLVYFSDGDNEVHHKRMATDTTWIEVGVGGWDQDADGAPVAAFVDETTNGAVEQEADFFFPTVAVDRQSLPDRVYALLKWGDGAEESVLYNQYVDDGVAGTAAPWGTAAPVWSTGGTPLFRDGDQQYNIELNWTLTGRVAAAVDDRTEGRGDLHIAFTAGYSSAGVGGEQDVYYARYNGTSWTLPEKVADDDSDGAGTEDGLAAGDTYLLSPALAAHADSDNLFLAFGAGAGEGLGVGGVTDVDHHPYFKVLGRELTWEDESVPVGGYQYTLTYQPTNPQVPGATLANRPVYVHAADPVSGAGLGASDGPGDGFLAGTWERVGTSLQDTDKFYEGLVDEAPASDREWGDDGDKVGLLVKLNVLGSDSSTNLQVITGGTAAARSVHVGGAPPVSLVAGAYFALGADIDITAANGGPTAAISQPDGTGDVANLSYLIEYDLDDADDGLDTSLQAALYAYPSAGLRTVQDIRIFGTLIADQNDRSARNPAGTNDLSQGTADYTWDDPPTGLKTSALFASILRMTSGTYYIYLVVDDGQNPPVYAVSPGALTIVHSPVVQQIDPVAAETVDTGVRTGLTANPYDLDFSILDYDSDARVQLFYSAFAGLTSVSASGSYPTQSFVLGKSLSGTRATPITASTWLSEGEHEYSWDVSDPLVADGAYYLYAVATDSTNVTVGYSAARLTVQHSPSFTFYEPARNTQRTVDSGSQPVYTIQWQKGSGDGDLDDDATIALYFTTVDPATKNYTGTDSTDLVAGGDGAATLITGPLQEDPDGPGDMYVWDFRTAGSAPPEGQQVWLYAVVADDDDNTAVELGGSLVTEHSPYILLKTRLPEVNQGDVLRLEWDDYMVDDGLGTDDAHIRLYASRESGLSSLVSLEAGVAAGTAHVINSSDGTAAGALAIRESDANAYAWDTKTSTFALPVGGYSVYAGISADETFGDNSTGRVSESVNLLSVKASTGATPHMAVSPNRVVAGSGDTLTFEVLVQSQGVPATAYSVGIEVPASAFTVVNAASPFTDLGSVFAGGTELENATVGTQLRFAMTGTAETIGSESDPVAAVRFQVVATDLTGTQALELDDEESAISTVDRSVPLRRSTGMSAIDAQVKSMPRGRIRGFVLLEGRAPPLGNGDHATLLDVHLRIPGSVLDITDSAYRQANDDHPATVDTVEVETAQDGEFLLESIPSGRYVLALKDTSHLSGRTDTITIRPGESVLLTSALGLYASDIRGDASFLLPQDGHLLQAGDVTEDNEIDEDDINAIDAAWGTDPGKPRFAQADVNNDGRVSVEDLTAAISNISNTTGFGAPPVYKGLATGANGAANGSARLELLAPDHEGGWWAGSEIDLVVAARDLVDLAGFSLELTYDPAQVELVGGESALRAGDIFAPNPAGYYARAEQEEGRVFLAAARRGKSWSAAGSGDLLRFRVRLHRDGFPNSLAVREGVLLSTGYERQPIRLEDLWQAMLPRELKLSQNYPNPFNPSTTIPFTVPSGREEAAAVLSQVRLEVYNALGQRIRTLVDDDRGAGFYRVRWDGRDRAGREVASGLYLYRLQAGQQVQLARMMLIR